MEAMEAMPSESNAKMQQFPDLAAVPCKNEDKDIAWLGLGQHFHANMNTFKTNWKTFQSNPISKSVKMFLHLQSIMNNYTPPQSHNYNFHGTQPLGPRLLGNAKGKLLDLWRTETYRNVPLRCFPQCSRANSIPSSAPSTWHDMSKIEIVCSPSSASHQPSTELRQDVGPAWQLLLCFRQGAIGVLVKQHPGLLSPQAFGEGLIWGHRVRTYQAWWLNSRSTTCLLLLCIPHVICIYVYM